jgi:hypothetical protein
MLKLFIITLFILCGVSSASDSDTKQSPSTVEDIKVKNARKVAKVKAKIKRQKMIKDKMKKGDK